MKIVVFGAQRGTTRSGHTSDSDLYVWRKEERGAKQRERTVEKERSRRTESGDRKRGQANNEELKVGTETEEQ